jgi:hypothetical protein
MDECNSPSKINKVCSRDRLKEVGLDPVGIDKCVEDSYVTKDGAVVDNLLLKEDREWSSRLGIILHPSITINNITYRGDINGYDVFRAVCAGF